MPELQVSRKEIEECQANIAALVLIAKGLRDTCDGSVDRLIEVCEFAAVSEAGCKLIMAKLDEAKSGK